jgi:hypothetical protein
MERLNYERVLHSAELLRRQNDKLMDCIQSGILEPLERPEEPASEH